MMEDGNRPRKTSLHLLMSALQLLLWVSICARPGLVIAQQEAPPAPTPHEPRPKTPDGKGGSDQGGTRVTGGHTTTAGHGNTAVGDRGSTPGRNVSLKGAGTASVRANGQIRSIDRGGMHIEHGVHGGRTVVSEHNGARVVTKGRGGYVQRAYMTRGGRSYYSRTYVVGGVVHVGVYRGYYWGGRLYYSYYPAYWYHSAFYAWAYNAWPAPVYWGTAAWGWGGAPWYGFYGGFFAPYPYYASPAFWLTDYLIAANLRAAYAAQTEGNADAMASAAGGGNAGGGDPSPAAASNLVTLIPQVKHAIAEEAKAELAAQAEEAQSGASGGQAAAAARAPTSSGGEVPPALNSARRTFVVASDLSVVANGQDCGLTLGDVIVRLTDTPDADNMVNASVSASKKSDCAAGQTVAVKVDDLQEMQNHFAEQLNSGLGELAKKQGTGGMPKAPDTSTVASDVPAPPPDTTAEQTLQDQQQAADQIEAQVKQEATSGQAEAVRDNNAFAVELYGQLRNRSGNLFFSPESISTALAMTYAGARADTAAEMAKTLHFTLSPGQLHPAMGALLRDRNAAHDGYQLKEADALWVQQGYSLLPEFLKLNKDNYEAGLNQVDFKGATEASRQTINQWVEQRTENKIRDLLQPGILNSYTRLVLTNAIYFKGDWDKQFKKEDTKDEDFHLSSAQAIKTPLMHMTKGFNYFDGGSFQALEIPYKNKELSMIILLPQSMEGLSAFEQSLSPASMQQLLEQLRPAGKVIVTTPKCKMEAQFVLKDTLIAMGMKKAFDGNVADFSGTASRKTMQRDGNGNLYIGAVIHKAYVDVNEEGTEAAAATAVVHSMTGAYHARPNPPIVFRADHPFMFLIRDNRSGSILFIGRVTNPSR